MRYFITREEANKYERKPEAGRLQAATLQAVAATSQYNPSYNFGFPPGQPWPQTNLGQKPKLGGVRIPHRHYIHVHTLMPVVGAHTFSLYCPCQFISFSCFLLVCLKNLNKNQKNQLYLLASLLSMPVVVVIKNKTQKDFPFFFCLLGAFPCKQFVFFLSFRGREEKTIMKMLSGSHVHYC